LQEQPLSPHAATSRLLQRAYLPQTLPHSRQHPETATADDNVLPARRSHTQTAPRPLPHASCWRPDQVRKLRWQQSQSILTNSADAEQRRSETRCSGVHLATHTKATPPCTYQSLLHHVSQARDDGAGTRSGGGEGERGAGGQGSPLAMAWARRHYVLIAAASGPRVVVHRSSSQPSSQPCQAAAQTRPTAVTQPSGLKVQTACAALTDS
jgi:hypothetical protein